MDNQKPVLQTKPYSYSDHFLAIIMCVATILMSAIFQAFHYFYATLFVFAFLLLVLFVHFNDIKRQKARKETNIMSFYADGRIEYNNKVFNAKDYLGITTINNDDAQFRPRSWFSFNYIVLISKDKFANNNLYVFDIPMYLNEIELNEVVQLKKNIANITHLPIFNPCEKFVLRDNLTIWQEENIDHLILYNQHKSNQIEIILYCCLFTWFTFTAFSNYYLFLTIAITMLSFISCYLLFSKYRFEMIFIFNPFDILQIKINNDKLLYKNKEIAFGDIKQIKIKDIYAQKYYIYSRLKIELNNGKKIKLFVSTPQVKNPKKLREFLSDKLPNKLIDEDKIF